MPTATATSPETTIATPFGELRVIAHGATSVSVHSEAITINGVSHRARVSLVYVPSVTDEYDRNNLDRPYRQVGGGWAWSDLLLRRNDAFRNGRYDDSPSDSASTKFKDTLGAVAAYLSENPEFTAEGADQARQREVAGIESQIAAKLDEVRALQARLAALVEG